MATMTVEQARESISYHSCSSKDVYDRKFQNGFLGSLRPFKGELNEKNFINLMESIMTLQQNLRSGEKLNQDVLLEIMTIIKMSQTWAADGGDLMKENLMTTEQQATLLKWAEIMNDCLYKIIENNAESAFISYKEYMINS